MQLLMPYFSQFRPFFITNRSPFSVDGLDFGPNWLFAIRHIENKTTSFFVITFNCGPLTIQAFKKKSKHHSWCFGPLRFAFKRRLNNCMAKNVWNCLSPSSILSIFSVLFAFSKFLFEALTMVLYSMVDFAMNCF